jgi:hypothetical protein
MTTGGMLDRTAIRLTKQACSVESPIDFERNHRALDLLHSTKQPWHTLRLYTLTQTLAQGCAGCGKILFNFAHVSRNIFAPSGLRDAKIKF